MSASRCSRPPPPLSPFPFRTARTLARGPCGSVDGNSIIGGIPSILGRAGPAPGSDRRMFRSRRHGFVAGRARDVQAVVDVAPSPVLVGLSGPDHWMAGLVEMSG